MRTTLASAAVAALCVAAPSRALAEGKVAVLDIQTTNVDPKLVGILTEVLTAQIQQLGIYDEVIAGRDVAAIVGFEKQKDLIGCTDESCVAELGGVLGVDHIVAGHVGKVGKSFIVNIKLINILTARADQRVYQTVRGDDDVLIKTIEDSVHKLVPAKSTEANHDGHVHAPPVPIESKPMAKKGIGAAPVILWGIGGAGIALGAIFGIKASGHESNATDPAFVGGQKEIDSGESAALLANIGFGVGIAGAAAGTLIWLLAGDDHAEHATILPSATVTADSAAVSITGRF